MDKKNDYLTIGYSYTLEKNITAEMVQAFADLTGDYNPVHMDEQYCKEHGMENRIAHGMLTLSFLSTLIGMHLPGEGAVWLSQNIDFIQPVKIGDTIKICGKVTEVNSSNLLNMDIITMKISISNQSGKIVARGSVKVTVK